MNSIKQFFSYMNDINFQYVVLRNWDSLPYDIILGEHSDLDILVYDFAHFFEIFQEAKLEYPFPRVRTKIPIDDSFLYVDVRYLGDDYYPIDFERAILSTREWNIRGFYTPSPIHHRIAMAYHCVHHKNGISSDYLRWLGYVTLDELYASLKESQVGWITPKDSSVGSYNGYWKGCTSIIEKSNGNVIKTQTSYTDYKLIENEFSILANVSSNHFPRVYKYADNSIEIEDCGNHLNSDNIPYDWEAQLHEIILDLLRCKLIHRDIRLDNLMVKNGVIKLIDFGWARFIDEPEMREPPSCLGYPNKPSFGFSDNYSMRTVSKQIEYMMDEKVIA